jgi:hypothetical protein
MYLYVLYYVSNFLSEFNYLVAPHLKLTLLGEKQTSIVPVIQVSVITICINLNYLYILTLQHVLAVDFGHLR